MKGLKDDEVRNSREENGSNELTQVEQDPIWKKVLEGFKDPMLIILLVALAIQVIFYFMGKAEWYEAVGILVAVLIANLVGVLSENSQENKAAELKAEAIAKEKVKVYRDGKLVEISINDVVVGDILSLQAGDKIPADGVLISGEIKVDQAALNGESEEADKVPLDSEDKKNDYIKTHEIGKDLMDKHFLYRGTVVCNGECIMEVTVVGDKSTYGKLALEMQEDTRETPLKLKLNKLADQISKFGYIGASAIAIVYVAREILANGVPVEFFGWATMLINAISLGVVIVCMAVPEGLPMMISMVLAMNMGKMMKDNVLVHKLSGIETAGSLNILFSDKTGTITKGQLSVVDFDVKGVDKTKDYIIGTCVNNSASASDGKVIGGNSTDRALLSHAVELGHNVDYKSNVMKFNAFDSTKKCSSIVYKGDNGNRVYVKGAAERVLSRCKKYTDENGSIYEITEDKLKSYNKYMDIQSSKSMRLIAVAYCDGEDTESEDLTLITIISIRDDVRTEAITAIEEVNKAGVQVVMVTGDKYETAVAIAKEAGLYGKDEKDIAITSAELAELSSLEVAEMLPHLRVVARALPTDKSRLVRIAQEKDLVVGMTGDGVNDSPALKKADVGFAMGSGTEVAKEAGDITILDDNFLSIEKAILYGRTIMTNIRKFLIFQLSVNVTTVALCFLAPLLGIAQPFSIITILYINLVMDTLAAIAFGCEPALQRYMKDKPISRSESIITRTMASQIGTVGVYSTLVGLLIILSSRVQAIYSGGMMVTEPYEESALLAFFMLTIIWNGFNARSNKCNIFEHIGENRAFIAVMASVLVLLVLLIHGIGFIAGLDPISIRTWICMFIGSLAIIPIDMIRKCIINK